MALDGQMTRMSAGERRRDKSKSAHLRIWFEKIIIS